MIYMKKIFWCLLLCGLFGCSYPELDKDLIVKSEIISVGYSNVKMRMDIINPLNINLLESGFCVKDKKNNLSHYLSGETETLALPDGTSEIYSYCKTEFGDNVYSDPETVNIESVKFKCNYSVNLRTVTCDVSFSSGAELIYDEMGIEIYKGVLNSSATNVVKYPFNKPISNPSEIQIDGLLKTAYVVRPYAIKGQITVYGEKNVFWINN